METRNLILTTVHLRSNKQPFRTKQIRKMSKKLMYFAFTLLTMVAVTSLTGCKKGANDPFLSFRSRMTRITGEWKLQEGIVTYSSNFGGTPLSETSTYTETTSVNDGVSVSYSETLTIEKDGTYAINITENGVNYTETGVWFFAGKIKDLDLKNKEAIILNGQVYSEPGFSQTLNGFHSGEPLIINQLRNDELIFKGETTHDTGSGNYGSNSSYEKRFVKK